MSKYQFKYSIYRNGLNFSTYKKLKNDIYQKKFYNFTSNFVFYDLKCIK